MEPRVQDATELLEKRPHLLGVEVLVDEEPLRHHLVEEISNRAIVRRYSVELAAVREGSQSYPSYCLGTAGSVEDSADFGVQTRERSWWAL